MTVKRLVIRILDRPGGRTLLALLATRLARRLLRTRDVSVRYVDGFWVHTVRGLSFPDGPRFDYSAGDIPKWADQEQRYLDDAREYWFRDGIPAEGDVVLDVGAGRGEDVLAFSRAVGTTGRVVAVEAHPASYDILQRFCAMNGLTNVVPVHCAMMDAPGTVTIADDFQWEANSVVGSRAVSGSGARVEAARLDELIARHGLGEIALLKMNIEGAERVALPGLGSAVGHVRLLCIACHDFRADWGHGEEYRTRDFVEDWMRSQGLHPVRRAHDPREYVRDHVFGMRSDQG